MLISLAFALALVTPQQDAEARVVEYLRANVKPGEPVMASRLANEVFTAPDERKALDRLFKTFFKVPLFLAQHQKSHGKPPTLAEISDQFAFRVPGEADVMLRIMESDPRLPKFFARDAKTGELTSVDVETILADARFGRAIERSLSGLEGQPAPAFATTSFAGTAYASGAVAGKPYVVYFWFSHCPPCVLTAPVLDERARAAGITVVAANADRTLELGVSDEERNAYAAKVKGLTMVHATPEMQAAFGGVGVYPTLFFVDKAGVVTRQLVSRQDRASLDAALSAIAK
jgi:cytochrome c biogenesis protein CcmG, thiol:disulfide interchange protein DsbE